MQHILKIVEIVRMYKKNKTIFRQDEVKSTGLDTQYKLKLEN